MGVNSKMFVATKGENILKILPKVESEFNKWQRKKLRNFLNENNYANILEFIWDPKTGHEKSFTNGVNLNVHEGVGSFNISFTIYGKTYSIFITHTCHSDYKDTYEGEKIIFSTGVGGLYWEAMKIIANVVKSFGDVYYTEDDSKMDFEKINV